MTSRIGTGIFGAIALVLCFSTLRDVPRNPLINNPRPTMTILWVAIALIGFTLTWALFRGSRKATIAAVIASGFGILFSIVVACV